MFWGKIEESEKADNCWSSEYLAFAASLCSPTELQRPDMQVYSVPRLETCIKAGDLHQGFEHTVILGPTAKYVWIGLLSIKQLEHILPEGKWYE